LSQQTTTATIAVTDFRKAFLELWEEVFTTVHGYILDKDTSFFPTLESITAEEASIPVSSQSASLAAQVNHTAFYVEALRRGLATNWEEKADWDASWQVGPVDDAQWRALIDNLRAEYEWVTDLSSQIEEWNENYIGGAIALVAHSAYHLGEVRQGIGVIRSRRT
jgi:hypothetical protein